MENRDFLDIENRDYSSAILELIRGDSSPEHIREGLEEYHFNDIAAVLPELTDEERDRLLDIVGTESMSKIATYLDDAGEYFSVLDAQEAADIIEQMDADEALEILDDLDDETREQVLSFIEDESVREEIELLDSYDDDEFGSRMSTNFISVKRGSTIKGAMKTLIAEAAENDNIYTVFVTNEDGSFYGAIDLKELIVARSNIDLEELIYTTFPYVCDKESISENIERLRSYSEDLIPVLSSKNKSILGVITSNDITDMIDDELGDDYAKLAALTEEEETDEKLSKSMKKRLPWLIALLFLGLGVSAVVGMFEGVVSELPVIVSFQSLILGMAGNVGTQSLAVTVRTLGADRKYKFSEQLMLIFREMKIAFVNGLALGAISFLTVWGYLSLFSAVGSAFALAAAGCVGGAMCFSMTISGMTGALIPIVLYRLGFDPAVASGPLITTINDLVAVVSFYGLSFALLLRL
ncbi:MAG: magnesium transporter [Ruminococcaceae bacterium]|nr:magnesium transporter [Oscillospiraceae bacterium]